LISFTGLIISSEELNKYLAYVRNLGFEDTPDYDYLRDLFTQALKNTGEVEDGEYDWMKINGGKGWEAVKQHSSHLHASNAVPGVSEREIRGAGTPRQTATKRITADHLNAALPPTPSPAKPGVGKTRERQSALGAVPSKRQSGAAGVLTDVATPAASTQAQFQNSNPNIPMNRGMSAQHNLLNQQSQGQGMRQTPEPKQTLVQRVMKAICCGKSLRVCFVCSMRVYM
jgi:casein kinase 1